MKASAICRLIAGLACIAWGIVRMVTVPSGSGALLLIIAGAVTLPRSEAPVSRSIRWILGCLGLFLFFTMASSGGGMGSLLISMAILILAAMAFSPELSRWAASPLTRLIDGIYFGNGDRDLPPVTLKLARHYCQERRFADAMAECERQLEYHPRNPELWQELLAIARLSGDAERLGKLLNRARRRVRGEAGDALVRRFG